MQSCYTSHHLLYLPDSRLTWQLITHSFHLKNQSTWQIRMTGPRKHLYLFKRIPLVFSNMKRGWVLQVTKDFKPPICRLKIPFNPQLELNLNASRVILFVSDILPSPLHVIFQPLEGAIAGDRLEAQAVQVSGKFRTSWCKDKKGWGWK